MRIADADKMIYEGMKGLMQHLKILKMFVLILNARISSLAVSNGIAIIIVSSDVTGSGEPV